MCPFWIYDCYRFRCKLFDFGMPQSKLFIPLNWDHTEMQMPKRSAPSSSGNMTPMPDCSPSLSPSLMASHNPTPATATSSSSIHPALPQHPFLDLHLLGVQLKVIVNGRHFKDKEAAITVEMGVEQLIIWYTVYKNSQSLNPAWVFPKHPHPTHDNGLLVVIKGKHCGKFMQWIHHKYDQETVIIILGVVKRMENSVDNLTGEQLELGADHLCEAIETKEDKQCNKTVMTALCKQAHKIQAK